MDSENRIVVGGIRAEACMGEGALVVRPWQGRDRACTQHDQGFSRSSTEPRYAFSIYYIQNPTVRCGAVRCGF